MEIPSLWTKSENKGVRTWGETTKKAEALDEIIDVIAGYLPPHSGLSDKEALSTIIGIIERSTEHQFSRLPNK